MSRMTRVDYLFLVVLTLVFGFIGLHWVSVYQTGQPFNIDESGYLCIAFNDYRCWIHEGVFGFLKALEARSIQAPITTGITAFLFVLFGVRLSLAMVVPLFFYGATIWVSYVIAREVVARSGAVLVALLVACCPAILVYSRDFIFAVPAMFFYTLAVLALVKSEHFSNKKWIVLFGVATGLVPLARTVTIAFVPSLWLAALLCAVMGMSVKQNLKHLGWSIVLSIFVAALWLARSGGKVFKYLTGYGYGAHAHEYGKALHINPLGIALHAVAIVNESINIFYLLFFAASLGVAAILCARLNRNGFRAFLKSDACLLLICVLGPLAALCSTQNEGTGFFVPVLPTLIALCVVCLFSLSTHRFYKAVLSAALLLVAGSGLLPALSQASILATPRILTQSVFGPLVFTNGEGVIQQWEAGSGYKSADSSLPVSLATGRDWIAFNLQTVELMQTLGGMNETSAIGFVHLLYNTGSVSLEEYLKYGRLLGKGTYGIDPVVTGNNVVGDLKWLTTGQAHDACFLLTAKNTKPTLRPFVLSIDEAALETAATQAGFEQKQQLVMPDGNMLILWMRPATCP